ncbi:HTH-type transcriptional regulator ImmR [Streptomyces sp. enrichment culture]|uniref:helix-turn-helix domain-containing protein n=1 Tax=Streptomyces sp. enrichment culture TaxID=1795815 RepID=UPI003F57D6D1
MDAGKKLRRFRERHGVTQRQVAEELGTTWQAVSRWERGVFTPNRNSLAKLAKFMRCSVDELMTKEEVTKKWNSPNT